MWKNEHASKIQPQDGKLKQTLEKYFFSFWCWKNSWMYDTSSHTKFKDLTNIFTKTKKLIVFVLRWKCSKTFTVLYPNNIATHKVEDTIVQLPFTILQGHSYAFL
jgi:hypothetical protein